MNKHAEHDAAPPALARLFSQTDREQIAAAIKKAEGRTAGEIVPFVVEQSDDYEIAWWRGGMCLSLSVILALLLLREFTSLWLNLGVAQIVILILGAQAAGMAAVYFAPMLRRFFAGQRLLDLRVTQRAAEAFVAEEIFRTKDRTGILIFLSLLERKVIVWGDVGINAKVEQHEWNEVVQLIISGMRAGQPSRGLIAAIEKCGELLHREGVIRRPDDTDELTDALRFGNHLN